MYVHQEIMYPKQVCITIKWLSQSESLFLFSQAKDPFYVVKMQGKSHTTVSGLDWQPSPVCTREQEYRQS